MIISKKSPTKTMGVQNLKEMFVLAEFIKRSQVEINQRYKIKPHDSKYKNNLLQ
ncbi:Hypothetical protein FNO222_0106 [Francisella orientalis]|uniref:Uncharacterized protein n=1 Tax=Francisella orientalis TaxID=299583 RepID=A0ABM5U462_9GAMM|nr:hypothetical protein FNO12_0106 [Francisella orientalis FNO12]AKN86451.1 Hypothetical protein FNO24_0106 [Francisella orientalis FNO24]AKN87989.1 Hypothetical protein FNO190_0106 [Francisella orientalis]AKU04743.1 Hypothetical protein FNO01_0106 [Francisella orientalis]QEN19651.1 Hypothetical protein FNO39_0106 [Francisella orientalis]